MSSSCSNLVVLLGPTAVGKTELSLFLAEKLQTDIVSADARQCYQGVPIGTAQPTAQEQAAATHHFVDCFPLNQPTNAFSFAQYVRHLATKKETLFLVGGSGLYIEAVCRGLPPMPPISKKIYAQLNNVLERRGLNRLIEQLQQLDPVYCREVDLNNPQRVIRALAVCQQGPYPFSHYRAQQPLPFPARRVIYVGLTRAREALYERINQRVRGMLKAGLLEEVTGLWPWSTGSLLNQTIGYKEFVPFFEKKKSLEQVITDIQRNSRRYAKRQYTFFHRNKQINWFHPEDKHAIWSYIKSKLI